MAKMSVRSTYALDEKTAERIRYLARSWDVSQAEVIRRSIRLAVEREEQPKLSPADVVAHYADGPLPRNQTQTRRLIRSMRRRRHQEDEQRGGAAKP